MAAAGGGEHINAARVGASSLKAHWWQGREALESRDGDRGIRTPDLCDANAALSQLSYIPVDFPIIGPADPACQTCSGARRHRAW